MTTQLYPMNPETHRIVPIEPTKKQLKAVYDSSVPSVEDGHLIGPYQSAILAAPQPTPLQGVTAERVRELLAVDVESLLNAAKEVINWTQIKDRPPVRDELEIGRTTSVRVHALADLYSVIQAIDAARAAQLPKEGM